MDARDDTPSKDKVRNLVQPRSDPFLYPCKNKRRGAEETQP